MDVFQAVQTFGFPVGIAVSLITVFIYIMYKVVTSLFSSSSLAQKLLTANDTEAKRLFTQNDKEQRERISKLETSMSILQGKFDDLKDSRIKDSEKLMSILNQCMNVIGDNTKAMKENTHVVTRQGEYLRHVSDKFLELKSETI